MSGLQYYVYYKVPAAREAELRAAVDALFGALRAATGIQGSLQRRRDDAATFMETYPGVVDTTRFEQALGEAVESSGFAGLGIARVTEIFQCA